MAQIPRYDTQVDLNALPGQRQQIAAPADAFGAQYAKDIGQVGKVIGAVGDALSEKMFKEIDAANKAAVTSLLLKADESFKAKRAEILDRVADYTGPEPKSAVPLAADLTGRSGDAYAEIADKIADPDQKAMFIAKAQEKHAINEADANEAERAAHNSYMGAVGEKNILSAQSELAAIPPENFTKPVLYNADGTTKTAVDLQIDKVRDGAEIIGHAKGWDSQTIKNQSDKAVAQTIEKLIGAAIDKGATTAAAYLMGTYKDILSADQKIKLSNDINEQAIANDGSNLARHSLALGKSLPEVIAAIDDTDWPTKRKDEVSKIVKQKYAENEQIKNLVMRDANQVGERYFQETGRKPERKVWDAMSNDARAAILAVLEKVARGESIVTDMTVYGALRNIIAAGGDEALRLDLSEYADKLSIADRKSLADSQAALLKPDTHNDEISRATQASTAVKLLGLRGKEEGLFLKKFNDEVDAAASAGKPLDYKGRAALITRLSLPTDTGWGGTGRAYQAKPGDKVKFEIDDSTREELKAQAKRLGRDFRDEDVIQELYLRKYQ